MSDRLRQQTYTSAAEPRPGHYDQPNDLFNYRSVPAWTMVSHLDKHVRGPFARQDAVKNWPYIELNQKNRIWHIVLDLDCDDAILDWYDSDIPFLPSYFVGRQRKGRIVRPHAVIKLSIPVDKGSWSQMRLLKIIRRKIFDLLIAEGGEEGYQDFRMPPRSKNPRFKKIWKTKVGDPRSWTLYELRDALSIPKKEDLDAEELRLGIELTRSYIDEDEAAKGRNCGVFQRARGPAYGYKKHALNEDDLFSFTLDRCIEINDDYYSDDPLDLRDLKEIARSVSNWTWINYKGSGVNDRVVDHGACHRAGLIDKEMSLSEKQAVGGKYGATQYCLKTLDKVKAMLKQLQEEGRELGIKAMSREFSISRNTIKKYVEFARAELLQNVTVTPVQAVPEGGVKPVYQESGHREKPTPDLTAKRDGKLWEFWLDPQNPDILIDKEGHTVPRVYVNSYIVYEKPPDPIEIPDCLL